MYCFFFNDTATTEIYTLSLHDALPIFFAEERFWCLKSEVGDDARSNDSNAPHADRKSTRLNSSHPSISYAVFCLKKKIKLIKLVELESEGHDSPPSQFDYAYYQMFYFV